MDEIVQAHGLIGLLIGLPPGTEANAGENLGLRGLTSGEVFQLPGKLQAPVTVDTCK